MDDVSKRKLFGGCPHDCPDTCAMLYEVKDNKLLSVKGNPDHPMTRGGLCVNCLLYTSPSPRDMSASRMPSSA